MLVVRKILRCNAVTGAHEIFNVPFILKNVLVRIVDHFSITVRS